MRRDQRQRIDAQVRQAVEPTPADVSRLTGPDARRVMFGQIITAAAAGTDGSRPPAGRRRPVLVAAAAALVAAGAGVVWAATDRPAAPPVAQPTSIPAADIGRDRYTASDLRFYAPLRPARAAAPERPPATLEAALTEATATVVARVAGVRPGRTIGEPPLRFIEVELTVIEVVRGALRPELGGVVRVEFTGASGAEPVGTTVAAMRSQLPANPAVWLLSWQGEPPANRKPGAGADDPTADTGLYRVVHPACGVFAQGEGSVVAVTAPAESAATAQRQGERFRTLGELVAKARG